MQNINQAPATLSFEKVATLGDEEDCGEFKFENVFSMVVHQKRNWLFISDWKSIHIFDLATKKNLKTLNCKHLWGLSCYPSCIDLDYNDETFFVSADDALFKLNFDGDLIWKLDYQNREKLGVKIHPEQFAVNQSDSSILLCSSAHGKQTLQMMTKDGKGGKIISGSSRYNSLYSVCYSGYGDQFYVGDSSMIYLIDSNGKVLKEQNLEFPPQAMRVDYQTGCLIMSDNNKRIRFVNMDGYSKSFAEDGSTSCCEVSDQLGELYVAFHNKIFIYKSSIQSQLGIRPLPNAQPLNDSPNRNMKRVAILGEEEDCGEFKFEALVAMVVHQKKKHLLVAERTAVHIFDLNTKRHIRKISVPNEYSIFDIDIDYNDDSILVATLSFIKFSYEGDIIWKIDSLNREKRGMRFIPQSIAVNQKDSSIMCLTEGRGTQAIQMCTKDGKGEKIISEDSQGKSRYECLSSIVYSGNEDQFFIGDNSIMYLINSKGKQFKKHNPNSHLNSMKLDRKTGNILVNDYNKSVRLLNMEGYDRVLVNDGLNIKAVDILDESEELFIGTLDQVFIYKSQ